MKPSLVESFRISFMVGSSGLKLIVCGSCDQQRLVGGVGRLEHLGFSAPIELFVFSFQTIAK